MSSKINFDKPVLNINKKIELLKERGLIFNDEENEKSDLQHIWYFRLTWYFKFFQNKENNLFLKWTTFKQVLDLYIFDRKLRLLTLDAVEKIEVSLKANINDYMSEEHWIYWYLDESLFSLEKIENIEIYKKFKKNIVKNIQTKEKALFVKEFFKKYDEKFLPGWMLFEELTIWSVSTIFNILKWDYCKKISENYNVYYVDLRKWLNLIVQIRNISAHYSRLWNNNYKVRPRIQDTVFKEFYLTESNWNQKEVISNYYNFSLITNYLLKKINNNLNWLEDLDKLFLEFPSVPKIKMWFDKNWKENFTK